ncbi:hypothetical protein K435DRAFT_418089 [Dendrothele bispora CBS 962.96]|uniref:Uncharacterized protein n=1 Tax=Dendrothele bispora (strain CBS 962.96) TaxID=1314807 RepID=A0A4S8MUR1_DENBC|nr:hypothetical protein K435DRAFT_418089 [Dendrothele bispora CBS 962.96]
MGTTSISSSSSKRRGRPSGTDDSNRHPYLQMEDGSPVPKSILSYANTSIRELLDTINRAGYAPTEWRYASEMARTYVYSRILNDSRLKFFQLAGDTWKVKIFVRRVFSQWKGRKGLDVKFEGSDEETVPPKKKQKTKAAEKMDVLFIDDDSFVFSLIFFSK